MSQCITMRKASERREVRHSPPLQRSTPTVPITDKFTAEYKVKISSFTKALGENVRNKEV